MVPPDEKKKKKRGKKGRPNPSNYLTRHRDIRLFSHLPKPILALSLSLSMLPVAHA
jgi:hypothetical protein